MHDLFPTKKRQQTMDNTVDGRCFECQQLWEDTNHILRCPCESRCTARTNALTTFRQHLTKQHTPNIMASLLCTSMTSWLNCSHIAPPIWTPPDEPIMPQLTAAFKSQCKIGWDHFFRGRIAKDWRPAIQTYYHE